MNRLTLSIITTATAVTSGLLLMTTGGPRITPEVAAYNFIGTLGLFAAIVLGARTVISATRKKDD